MAENQSRNKVHLLKTYDQLFVENWRNLVYYGGRSSGKSRHVAEALLIRGRRKKLRIVCAREIQKTIDDSVKKLLADLIANNEYGDYVVKDKMIINTQTGTEFIFIGLWRNPTGIKSLEGADICWVEEAQSISYTSLDILVPTIRKPGSQLIYTFNRQDELDPVYVRYVMNTPANTHIRKVNYDVLEKAGLLPDEMKQEIAADEAFPDKFAHVWLGEPLNQSESSVIQRGSILEAMGRSVEDDGQIVVGVDVARMGDDRTVFVKRKGLATKGTKIYKHLRTTEVCDRLEQFVDQDKTCEIRIDDTGVGGGVTDEMLKRGYNVVAINFGGEAQDKDKYPNWISEAWFHMAEVMGAISLPLDNDLLMELSTRQWKQDNKGKRRIEGKGDYKKRGFRSPDIADAYIICFAEHRQPEPSIRWL